MHCILCQNTIDNYSPEFNQMKLDDTKTVSFCDDCIRTFMKWQQRLFAKMYPTTYLKKLARKKV